jgi:putative aldouronate transport system permease protein
MLLPTLVIVGLFTYRPVAYWVIGFTDYNVGRSPFSGKWNNFREFIAFFKSSQDAGRIISNTLSINICSLFASLIGAMAFAILLNEIRNRKLKSFVQTLSLLPYFVSWVITYSFFQAFFSYNSGLVNALLVKAGILSEGINLLGSPKYGLVLMVTANVWKSLGYNAVIFLATISGIDQEQYESAEIDGAGRWAKIRHITIPSLTGTLAVLLILNSGWIFNSNMDQFYQFTNPANLPTIEVFDMYVYRYGLKLMRFSYATAVGVCKTIVSLALLVMTNWIYRRLAAKSIF